LEIKDELFIELIAYKSFDLDFSEFFKIENTPKYILLDKEGKILEPIAPRANEIEKLLNFLSL